MNYLEFKVLEEFDDPLSSKPHSPILLRAYKALIQEEFEGFGLWKVWRVRDRHTFLPLKSSLPLLPQINIPDKSKALSLDCLMG